MRWKNSPMGRWAASITGMADTISSPLPAQVSHRHNRLIGIALMCAALICFSCLDATAKWVNRSVDPMVAV